MTQKKQKAEPNYVNFCPVCNSTDVQRIIGDGGAYFNCNNCNYSSQIFPEIDSTKLEYLKPVPIDKVNYSNMNQFMKYNPVMFTATIMSGIILIIFGIYSIYSSELNILIILLSLVGMFLGLLLILNAIKQKKARKND